MQVAIVKRAVQESRIPLPYIVKDLYYARPGKKVAVRWRESEKTIDTRLFIITVKEIDKHRFLITEEGDKFDLSRGDFDVIYSNRIETDDGILRFYYYDEF